MRSKLKKLLDVVERLRVGGLKATDNVHGIFCHRTDDAIVYDDRHEHRLHARWKWPLSERRVEMIRLMTDTFDEPCKGFGFSTPEWRMTWDINGVRVTVMERDLTVSCEYVL